MLLENSIFCIEHSLGTKQLIVHAFVWLSLAIYQTRLKFKINIYYIFKK
jgi:EamA domain-containing membrane protein RarD